MSESQSNWYYFCSTGCGFCKKVEPLVDELNKENDNPELEILRLDLADGDNKKLAEELKKKYKVQCGTPWFINAETGKGFCGFREKDIIEKWLNGEDIPAPPKQNGPMPRLPFHGANKQELNEWKKQYKKWTKENSHLPNIQTADQLLARPRPKSDAPQMPRPGSTDKEINEWKKKFIVWSKENDHLPNIPPVDSIIQRIKSRPQQPNQMPPGQMPPSANPMVEKRLQSLEDKMNRLMNHLGVK